LWDDFLSRQRWHISERAPCCNNPVQVGRGTLCNPME
jgi:hypothetical protein